MTAAWRQYEEDTAELFRSLGFDAAIDVRLRGVRTSHDVDVVARSGRFGFDVLWIVECKWWEKRVSKLHVIALREIVQDVGADRGILMSESGFQAGAYEAAQLTNVRLTSLQELRRTTADELATVRLRELHDRADACLERYWRLDKEFRIDHGLRPDVGAFGYSATQVVEAVREAVSAAVRGKYPIETHPLIGPSRRELRFDAATAEELLGKVETVIVDLESRLTQAEEALARRP